ncbi:MAG: DUF3604 domain-containing protein [Gammaproteobacteria bacterium]
MRLTRLLILAIVALGIATAGYIFGVYTGLYGNDEGPGVIVSNPVPRLILENRLTRQHSAVLKLQTNPDKQILFGDLHVHTTFSSDAFRMSLPMVQGEGAHPPADACNFARFCSALDFWSINDHAESITPKHWQETREAIRQCNNVSGNPDNPDLVAFLGWEWTQVGATTKTHYGHKNVIFLDTEDEETPARPIAAVGIAPLRAIPGAMRIKAPLLDFPNRQRYYNFDRLARQLAETPECPKGINTRDLPANCLESAATPQELFQKLDQWGFDTIVIPHGTSWGVYTPAGSDWSKQLNSRQHDPNKQILFEVFSGHGNSEEYRDWRAVTINDDDSQSCPEPGNNYLPSCWRAGEIIYQRCTQTGIDNAVCKQRAEEARQRYVDSGTAGWRSVPGATDNDWLDSGQCRDCFLPAYNLRPGGSAQYTLAITNFDEPEATRRFRFGFIASSDNHSARPGTGYKEFARNSMTDWWGYRQKRFRRDFTISTGRAGIRSVDINLQDFSDGFNRLNLERQASFFVTGGLVAVHSRGRRRDQIWSALKKKEVYATSGERILLWFDLLNAADVNGKTPMGSEVRMHNNPHFQVRAAGSFKQNPGCPAHSITALGSDEVERLCRGECYNPSDERNLITRIEVVRIHPQITPAEPLAELIEDPWRIFQCEPKTDGCMINFEDPDFAGTGRDSVYYVRAIEKPTATINGGNLRCEYDDNGRCISVRPCYGDDRTDTGDDCLTSVEPRAWSSPIFIDFDNEPSGS